VERQAKNSRTITLQPDIAQYVAFAYVGAKLYYGNRMPQMNLPHRKIRLPIKTRENDARSGYN
jgi:hypothetical protein